MFSGDDKIDETFVALPLSYGPHIQEDHRDSNPDPPFQDVVPSAFVTKLSKVAGDKIEESPAVVNRRTGFEPAWTMYSLLHSPAI